MELEDVYARNEEIISRRIVDELILVPLRKSVADMETLFTLNEVGARVYELIDSKRSVAVIVDDIVSEFAVTAEVAKSDVFEFIEQLLEVDAIRKDPGSEVKSAG